MGFAARPIAHEVRDQDVPTRPGDVNVSDWDNTLQPGRGRPSVSSCGRWDHYNRCACRCAST